MMNHNPGDLESVRRLWPSSRKHSKGVHASPCKVHLLNSTFHRHHRSTKFSVKLNEHAYKIHTFHIFSSSYISRRRPPCKVGFLSTVQIKNPQLFWVWWVDIFWRGNVPHQWWSWLPQLPHLGDRNAPGNLARWNSLKISLVCSRNVSHHWSFLFWRSNIHWWVLSYNVAEFLYPWTMPITSFR